ncbi:MAG TPA: antitoxin Xre/MbcA/ParS toxin-binding domain-containing protein, partial [Thalassobaculum sp.]
PEATVRRAREARKPLSRAHSERLYDVARVLDAVGRAYHGDRGRIEAFLIRPHPLLDGETPLDLATSSSAGAEAVLNLIHRAEAGVAP